MAGSRALLPDSKAREIVATSVPVHGITQLRFRSHPTGSSAPETITITLSYIGSDKLVYTTMLIKRVGPWPPAPSLAGPILLLESLTDHFRRKLRFLRMPLPRVGAPIWLIPRFLAPGLIQTAGSLSAVGSQGSNVSSAPLGSRLQGGQVMIATDKSTVVFPISSSRGTHSHSLLRLVVEQFLWLQS